MKTVLFILMLSFSMSVFAGTSSQDPNAKAIRDAFEKADPMITNYYGWVLRLNCTEFSAKPNDYSVRTNIFTELERSGIVFSRTDLPKNYKPVEGELVPTTYVQSKEGLVSIVTPAKVHTPEYTAYYVFRIVRDDASDFVIGEISVSRNDGQSVANKWPERSVAFPNKNVVGYLYCGASSNWTASALVP